MDVSISTGRMLHFWKRMAVTPGKVCVLGGGVVFERLVQPSPSWHEWLCSLTVTKVNFIRNSTSDNWSWNKNHNIRQSPEQNIWLSGYLSTICTLDSSGATFRCVFATNISLAQKFSLDIRQKHSTIYYCTSFSVDLAYYVCVPLKHEMSSSSISSELTKECCGDEKKNPDKDKESAVFYYSPV